MSLLLCNKASWQYLLHCWKAYSFPFWIAPCVPYVGRAAALNNRISSETDRHYYPVNSVRNAPATAFSINQRLIKVNRPFRYSVAQWCRSPRIDHKLTLLRCDLIDRQSWQYKSAFSLTLNWACIYGPPGQMDKRKEPSSVDIKNILLDMRKYRMGLIQTPDQLRFSYMAVLEGAKSIMGDSSVQVHTHSQHLVNYFILCLWVSICLSCVHKHMHTPWVEWISSSG